ncbi:sensor histidine kinase [Actinomycetospora termitidis]|uniref:histidine kinase n=1 Tax=Actinomycetospora termitidis TaxID=3053470 RepID=A0ABT7M4N6_9PSEU|nr:ATP-binding protein [Actinomycetospora sp. Odt1-22]MDL5155615.1 ATP-binding protein [Actinomycetospora sp. Odt1-22]
MTDPTEERPAVRRWSWAGRRSTLAGQALALQLGVVALVLVAVAAVSVTQSLASFTRTESRRVLAVAEDVAVDGVVRQALGAPAVTTRNPVTAVADNARAVSSTSAVVVADADLTVVTATDLALVGTTLTTLDADGGSPSRVAEGRSWTGYLRLMPDAPLAVAAQVPVLATDGRRLGAVAVTSNLPDVLTRLAASAPDLLTYLCLATALGVLGSLLLARRVKRQTLGLEPREITALVQHREAMLLGIREGVLGVDAEGRVVLVNDTARELLDLPDAAVGRTLIDLGVDPEVRAVLGGAGQDTSDAEDAIIPRADAVVVANRRPFVVEGAVRGWVTTLRDRTELAALQRELGTTRGTTETLRAQAHEFSNRLHTISGLIEIGEYDEVVRYVGTLEGSAEDDAMVTGRIGDPSLAALLVAKARLARERGVVLEVTGALGRVSDDLSADLVTVVGNLVDNALDVLATRGGGTVGVDVTDPDPEGPVGVEVSDTGPGVSTDPPEAVFGRGVSTKGDGRGIGLALVRAVCIRRGGEVAVTSRPGEGAVFTARLPRERTS